MSFFNNSGANIAVIPARGNSKRIPGKNIRYFNNKPMVAWPVLAAKKSGLFERIIVSTDDVEIAEISKQVGAEVPFVRPAKLATDSTGTTQVIAHATEWMLAQGIQLNAVCCIYATAPFIRAKDLVQGLEQLESGDWDYAFSATEFASPVFRSFKARQQGGVEMIFPEFFSSRSQDLPSVLHDAGQFYWGRPFAWIEGRRVYDHRSLPIRIPRWRVQDIDNEEDWVRAEIIAPAVMSREM